MMGLLGDENCLIVGLAVSIQYTSVTDGRTDGHRTTANTALCMASAVKMDDPKVFKLGTGNDLGISYKRRGFEVSRLQVRVNPCFHYPS